jgi:hypothetical protein
MAAVGWRLSKARWTFARRWPWRRGRRRGAEIDGAPSRVARVLEESDHHIAQVRRQLPALRRVLDAK